MYGVDKLLYDFISDNIRVRAIMGASTKAEVRCMPYNPAIPVKAPLVTYYETDSDGYLHIPGCQQMTYRIDIWTSSLEQSTRLAEEIDDMLSGKQTNSGFIGALDVSNEYARILKFTLFTSGDTYDDQTKVYHKSLVYKVVAIDKTIV